MSQSGKTARSAELNRGSDSVERLFAGFIAEMRKEAKSYMEKANRQTSNADYYAGKSWAYDDAADRLEAAIISANIGIDKPNPTGK
jgi:hypothetical protein